jgi:hypothetical protein
VVLGVVEEERGPLSGPGPGNVVVHWLFTNPDAEVGETAGRGQNGRRR